MKNTYKVSWFLRNAFESELMHLCLVDARRWRRLFSVFARSPFSVVILIDKMPNKRFSMVNV